MKKFTSISVVVGAVAVLALSAILWFFLDKSRDIPSFPGANVLLITIDTIRPDYLSCYGSSNQTPNIDALAKRGILFESAFCQVPLTFPSHTSILTGLFPVNHGVHQNGIEIWSRGHGFGCRRIPGEISCIPG